jgi:hypothetical protein
VRPGALNDALSGLLAAIRDRESER